MNEVNKTLYIPLYGKSYVSKKGLFLQDKKAEEMVKNGGGQVRFELQNLVVSMAVTRYDWPLPGLRFGLNQVEAQDFMDKGAPESPEEFSVQSLMQFVDQTLAEMGLRRDYHG